MFDHRVVDGARKCEDSGRGTHEISWDKEMTGPDRFAPSTERLSTHSGKSGVDR